DNFWQAGPTGPCGPCSELYYDRGPDFGADEDRPGDDTERMLEFWNLVFMQYELGADGSLTPVPKKNIDTGLGLERTAALLQGVPSVYETENFRPLVELGEELSSRRYGQDYPTTRALRILADLVVRAKEAGTSWIDADDAFRLHDTYGFPYELTKELLAEEGLSVDDQGFEELMERAREVARGGASAVAVGPGDHERVMTF